MVRSWMWGSLNTKDLFGHAVDVAVSQYHARLAEGEPAPGLRCQRGVEPSFDQRHTLGVDVPSGQVAARRGERRAELARPPALASCRSRRCSPCRRSAHPWCRGAFLRPKSPPSGGARPPAMPGQPGGSPRGDPVWCRVRAPGTRHRLRRCRRHTRARPPRAVLVQGDRCRRRALSFERRPRNDIMAVKSGKDGAVVEQSTSRKRLVHRVPAWEHRIRESRCH